MTEPKRLRKSEASSISTARNPSHAHVERAPTLAELTVRLYENKTHEQVEHEAIELSRSANVAGDAGEELFKCAALIAAGKQFGAREPTSVEQRFLAMETCGEWLDHDGTDIQFKWYHKYFQTGYFYLTASMACLSAVVQGMDQANVNAAQLQYTQYFHISDTLIQGLVAGAPYLCCCTFSCWLGIWLNNFLGRRATIWVSCAFAIVASVWQMCSNSTWSLFGSRFLLGMAIGPKSCTASSYAAEVAPPRIRGALGCMWQFWTAFGIFLGTAVGRAFYDLSTPTWGHQSGWRLTLGSTMVPAFIVCALIMFAPESPRWYMKKGRTAEAYQSLLKLRHTPLQAARDLYDISARLSLEEKFQREDTSTPGFFHRRFRLFSVPRNRRAAQSAGFLMLMQQFCGINVIAYYSTMLFKEAGFNDHQALDLSVGFGLTNFLFAIPGILTIDGQGRRKLLLTTFPLMGLSLIYTLSGFYISEGTAKVGVIASGVFIFTAIYSPGMGPVPYTYSAECYPLDIRDTGMAFATAICWGFNFVLAFTWPKMKQSMTPQGALGFYAGCNIVAYFITYFCLPETKNRSLEALDGIFQIPTHKLARIKWYNLRIFGRKHDLPLDLLEIKHILDEDKAMGIEGTIVDAGAPVEKIHVQKIRKTRAGQGDPYKRDPTTEPAEAIVLHGVPSITEGTERHDG